ncbi:MULTISPECIES: hypothetical protein [Idiomarina]|jgi:hypothetical protein|uniref:Uncharacterized protein n=1 Tax=Idiomarina abyssalis TaxID=86102 RepID=A0A8I1G377_9GAMM|nr:MULTISPECIES: hypothetical protein [Idiomarina]RDX34079.1 hypothetical protein DZA32_01650 [Idiomarina sp. HD9-110m-PIT-SAG04]MBJ7267378.1 hypothetical protein [Idiomarina abyssalis]MBJ7273359.1 hypothetical protein [Idiomarina abyssalis]MBJ7315113.1 hypothetical protein [Idiomarina abyssalis]MDA6066338.1 hypothetical protein [Idiomarina abyssalis]|tara:strand:- start:879190 stop:879696 length:507 start_codon:yes stop_codon:yes gene_type:complete
MVADIPAGFDQWEWSKMPLSQHAEATGYFLKNPETPDWEVVKDFYSYCPAPHRNFWICPIGSDNWTFFKGDNGSWILSKIILPYMERPKLEGPFHAISKTDRDGKEVWVYLSTFQFDDIKKVLKFTYSQKIESFQSVEKQHDVWIFKEDMGRLMFSEQGEYVILVHIL